LISTELLSIVLGKQVTTFTIEQPFDQQFICLEPNSVGESSCLDIHYVAHLVKQWAYVNHKYSLASSQHRERTMDDYYKSRTTGGSYYCTVTYITEEDIAIQLNSSTEPEAIFAAGEWILDQGS